MRGREATQAARIVQVGVLKKVTLSKVLEEVRKPSMWASLSRKGKKQCKGPEVEQNWYVPRCTKQMVE